MPSKQQVMDNVLAVEELVHEIKENLRLKARPAATTRMARTARSTPYHIPCRSWADSADKLCNAANSSGQQCTQTGQPTTKTQSTVGQLQLLKKKDDSMDDPYELLQTLLKSNNLVKEAVRRLQLNLSPKQRYFYESDEESPSPILRMCQLEL